MAASAVAGAVIGFFIRDGTLRWAIRQGLLDTRCPACTYSMLGLTVEDGHVTCPECGLRTSLAERGLSPELLMARNPGEDAAVSD